MAWYDIFTKGFRAERRTDGSWSYMLDPSSNFSGGQYLSLSLTNIALLTAFDIRSTMLSRANVRVKDLQDKVIEKDPYYDLIENPNFFESKQDFIKKHLWFKMLGTGITRAMPKRKNADVHDINNVDALEHLIPSQIDYQDVNKYGNFVRARSQKKELEEREILYKISGKDHKIPIKDLIFFYDIAPNMMDEGVFKSPSRIDGVIKEVRNIEEAQASKNKNLIFSHKWLVHNKGMTQGVNVGLEKGEKGEIETNFTHKDINATNSNVGVEALSNDFRKMMLDDNISSDAMRIFSVFGINRKILNWWMDGQSSLGDSGISEQMAVVNWIQNSIQLEADDFANTYTTHFKYKEQGKKITLDFDDHPAMQVLETRRLEGIDKQSKIFDRLIKGQMPYADALRISGLDETEA